MPPKMKIVMNHIKKSIINSLYGIYGSNEKIENHQKHFPRLGKVRFEVERERARVNVEIYITQEFMLKLKNFSPCMFNFVFSSTFKFNATSRSSPTWLDSCLLQSCPTCWDRFRVVLDFYERIIYRRKNIHENILDTFKVWNSIRFILLSIFHSEFFISLRRFHLLWVLKLEEMLAVESRSLQVGNIAKGKGVGFVHSFATHCVSPQMYISFDFLCLESKQFRSFLFHCNRINEISNSHFNPRFPSIETWWRAATFKQIQWNCKNFKIQDVFREIKVGERWHRVIVHSQVRQNRIYQILGEFQIARVSSTRMSIFQVYTAHNSQKETSKISEVDSEEFQPFFTPLNCKLFNTLYFHCLKNILNSLLEH